VINYFNKNKSNLFLAILFVVIIHINDVRYFSEEFLFVITLKGIIDIFLMSFISSLLFLISKKFICQFKFR
jgi:hypothetical protein